MTALANTEYRLTVAVSTSSPKEVLVGDVIGLLDALGEEQAVVVGHDFGALIALNTALLRPDRVRGVVGLSVHYTPRGPISGLVAARCRRRTGARPAPDHAHDARPLG